MDMNAICGDNRFEIMAKAKEDIIETTNIETSPDEMKVLDSFLFRCWQMGWLKQYDKQSDNHECDVWDGRMHMSNNAITIENTSDLFPTIPVTCGTRVIFCRDVHRLSSRCQYHARFFLCNGRSVKSLQYRKTFTNIDDIRERMQIYAELADVGECVIFAAFKEVPWHTEKTDTLVVSVKFDLGVWIRLRTIAEFIADAVEKYSDIEVELPDCDIAICPLPQGE